MNTGTKIRTILRVAVSLQTAICMTTAVVTNTNNKVLILVWAIFSIVCDFAVAFLTTYYNNDYTEEATIHTGRMRLMKAQKAGNIDGENFLDHGEEVQDDDI